MGKVYELSEVARWERWENSEVAQWERWEGSEMARWERWETSDVASGKIPCFIQGWGTQGETKVSSFCF